MRCFKKGCQYYGKNMTCMNTEARAGRCPLKQYPCPYCGEMRLGGRPLRSHMQACAKRDVPISQNRCISIDDHSANPAKPA
jgi:hypothetical protein